MALPDKASDIGSPVSHDRQDAASSNSKAQTAAPPCQRGCERPRQTSTKPQPATAVNWLNKVAEGVRL